MLFLTTDGSVCEAGVGASSLVTAQLLAKLSVMTKNKHIRVTFTYDKSNMRDPKRINTQGTDARRTEIANCPGAAMVRSSTGHKGRYVCHLPPEDICYDFSFILSQNLIWLLENQAAIRDDEGSKYHQMPPPPL
ncbi:hypothetical protein CBL_01815 [Carabus blaptoides fortunei]